MRLDGDELETHYRHVIETLGKQKGMLGVVFRKAQNKIQDPAKLRRLRARRAPASWRASPTLTDEIQNRAIEELGLLPVGRVPHSGTITRSLSGTCRAIMRMTDGGVNMSAAPVISRVLTFNIANLSGVTTLSNFCRAPFRSRKFR